MCPMATYTLAQAKNQLSKLVDEALTGTPVTITRHGKPVVHVTPAQPVGGKPMTKEEIDELARFRKKLPRPSKSGVEIIRQMRDEDWS
jgi:prevent-host-death family protein